MFVSKENRISQKIEGLEARREKLEASINLAKDELKNSRRLQDDIPKVKISKADYDLLQLLKAERE